MKTVQLKSSVFFCTLEWQMKLSANDSLCWEQYAELRQMALVKFQYICDHAAPHTTSESYDYRSHNMTFSFLGRRYQDTLQENNDAHPQEPM